MNSKVDLHMHSRASDGSDWIPDLLRKIQKLDTMRIKLKINRR